MSNIEAEVVAAARRPELARAIRPSEVRFAIPELRRVARPDGALPAIAAWIQKRVKYDVAADWAPWRNNRDLFRSPRVTLGAVAVDCDDIAILAVSLLLAIDVDACVVVGIARTYSQVTGHAWVGGHVPGQGFFQFEPQTGESAACRDLTEEFRVKGGRFRPLMIATEHGARPPREFRPNHR